MNKQKKDFNIIKVRKKLHHLIIQIQMKMKVNNNRHLQMKTHLITKYSTPKLTRDNLNMQLLLNQIIITMMQIQIKNTQNKKIKKIIKIIIHNVRMMKRIIIIIFSILRTLSVVGGKQYPNTTIQDLTLIYIIKQMINLIILS